MKKRKYILDTTLRDGEQAPGVCFSQEQKRKIAELLDNSGVFQIEAGIPAVSREEKQNVAKIMENRKNAIVSVWARLNPSDIMHSIDVRPDIIHISVPVSYSHVYVKLRKNKSWIVKQLYACIEQIQKSGIKMSAGFEDAFRADGSFIATVAKILLDCGVYRIRLCDTVGTANPSLCRDVLGSFIARVDKRAELGFHGHNDLGLATANTIEAAKTGCIYADVTVGGIGERAGNCDLAKLVCASGNVFDWGITPAQARQLQDNVFEIMGKKPSLQRNFAGDDAIPLK